MPIIVVDPGHGGRDPGTVGNGYEEKTLVLQTALLLRDTLRRCGFSVIMTRETDTLPYPSGTIGQDLAYRAQIANENNADLYVSWHIDSASSPDVNGAAVWIHPSTRGTRTDQWAEKMAAAIAESSGQKNRGVYLGDFQVLRDTSMDAVLVEAGFITNEGEANQLADPDFQRRQAEGAARAICNIFNLPFVAAVAPSPQPTPAPAPTQTPSREEIPAFAADAVAKVQAWGIMRGYPDGTFQPNRTVTRAELAVALVKLHDFIKNGG